MCVCIFTIRSNALSVCVCVFIPAVGLWEMPCAQAQSICNVDNARVVTGCLYLVADRARPFNPCIIIYPREGCTHYILLWPTSWCTKAATCRLWDVIILYDVKKLFSNHTAEYIHEYDVFSVGACVMFMPDLFASPIYWSILDYLRIYSSHAAEININIIRVWGKLFIYMFVNNIGLHILEGCIVCCVYRIHILK